MRYSVSNKQKPSTIPSRKCNNCIRASFVQFVAKISERHRKCYYWKIQICARQIFGAHSWRAKTAQLCHPSSTSSLIWGLKEFTEVHGGVLAASIQVSKYIICIWVFAYVNLNVIKSSVISEISEHNWSISYASSDHNWSISYFSFDHKWSISYASSNHNWSMSYISSDHNWTISYVCSDHNCSISYVSSDQNWSISNVSSDHNWSISYVSYDQKLSINYASSDYNWSISDVSYDHKWSISYASSDHNWLISYVSSDHNRIDKKVKVKSSMAAGASKWRIYYHRMWGQLSTTCSNLLK